MENKIHKSGKLRGEKITYKDGTGCCIWTILDDKNEEMGICFDFSAEDIEDMIVLLKELQTATPDIYEEDPAQEAFEEKRKKAEESPWGQLKNWAEQFSFCFTPFEWRFTTLFVTRPTDHNKLWLMRWLSGVRFGPFTLTWPRIHKRAKDEDD